MMNRFLLLILFLMAGASIVSCDNELKVIAPYKEIPIVYGMLNPQDTVQYLKINKAFLGEGDALNFAAEPDSTQLPYELDVQLVGKKANSVQQTITCTKKLFPKDPGIFGNGSQYLYVTPKVKLDSSLNYVLEVRRKADAKLICSADARTIGKFSTVLTPRNAIFYRDNAYYPTGLGWYSALNAYRYDLDILFTYTETNLSTGDSVVKTVKIPLVQGREASGTAGTEMYCSYSGQLFYTTIKILVPINSGVKRRVHKQLKYYFSLAGYDLNQYIALNGPITTLSDIKPVYSNIENGHGLFSSRTNKTFSLTLDAQSLQELKTGAYTGKLGFY